MITEIRSWRTEDGKVFESEAGATRHAGALAVRAWVYDARIGYGGEWSGQMVADAILDRPAGLFVALARFLGEEDG